MKLLFVFFWAFLFLFPVLKTDAQFQWPDGAKAAVCFTYDDGLDCHLDVAVPQLDEFELKGTFYCTGNSTSLFNRMEEWREIVRKGHELGNHTLFHPCDGNKGDWVKPEYDLNNYTPDQIIAELKTANTLLKAIDGKEKRTYGYTCSNTVAGGEDFTDDIQSLFIGARCDGPIPETMKGYDVYKTPSFAVVDLSADEMIEAVESARKKGTIVVFMFHSVGGGYLNVDAGEHRKLLEYIAENKDDYYNATFGEVMEYIKSRP
ncbi:polysaccharide deacetylase family protein [Maribellus comscasis]|uniref:Polysaccharide deacetylase family protein n=1 Tax=Maribellus comscasis TaxID=2681766 RepID=A0A6I6JUJ5_9BACT|nr:polysaccharide deacetylase family protein [Maribellus comscasis]QGY43832.1 polysaccharide deacetylase family protein [Maribellus comscasis]